LRYAQAKLYDRNGLTLGEFMRGDMYIRDMKNTKGHVTGLTCGQWHPSDRNTVGFLLAKLTSAHTHTSAQCTHYTRA